LPFKSFWIPFSQLLQNIRHQQIKAMKKPEFSVVVLTWGKSFLFTSE